MNRTKRQLLRCELARRLFIEKAGEHPLLRADIIDDAEGTGQTVRVLDLRPASARQRGSEAVPAGSLGLIPRACDSKLPVLRHLT